MNADKTLFIYTRVSSKQQVHRYSLQEQRNQGIAKAKGLGFDYKIYEDAGKSAASDDYRDRPELNKLMELSKKGEVKHLYVTELDRLARNEGAQIDIKRILITNFVTLHTIMRSYDLNDPDDEMLAGVISLMSRRNNQDRAKKSLRGKIEAVKNNGHHGGMVAYGYKTDEKKKLIIDEEEAKVYNRIVKLSLEGIGVHSIAKILNEDGIKPKLASFVKKELTKKHGVTGEIIRIPKEEMIWRGSSVLKILHNTLYKGERRFQDYIVPAPAIISKEKWEKIQENLKKNTKGTIKHKQVNKFLLHGMLLCNRCGNTIWAKEQKPRYKKLDGSNSFYSTLHFYYCSSQQRPSLENCKTPSLKRDLIDPLVWKHVTNLMSNSKLIKKRMKELFADKQTDKTKLLKRVKSYEAKLKSIDEEQNRLIAIYSKGIISEEKLAVQLSKKNEEKNNIQDQVIILTEQLKMINHDQTTENYITVVGKKITEIRNSTDFNFRKRFLKAFVKYIHIDYLEEIKQHVIEITLKYPFYFDSDQTITLLSDGTNVESMIDDINFYRYPMHETKNKENQKKTAKKE